MHRTLACTVALQRSFKGPYFTAKASPFGQGRLGAVCLSCMHACLRPAEKKAAGGTARCAHCMTSIPVTFVADVCYQSCPYFVLRELVLLAEHLWGLHGASGMQLCDLCRGCT